MVGPKEGDMYNRPCVVETWDWAPRRRVVVTSAFLHSDGFSHRYLYVIDITPVPNRFENSIGETESQNILNRLFSEIVIDPVHLLLFSNFQELFIQRSC